ncbi:MAG: hypothetical protein ACRCYO_18200 [Bacteroidia bacterium]
MDGGAALFVLVGLILWALSWGKAGYNYSQVKNGLLIYSIHFVLGLCLMIFGSIQTETGIRGAIGTMIQMMFCGIIYLFWGFMLLIHSKHKKDMEEIRSRKNEESE